MTTANDKIQFTNGGLAEIKSELYELKDKKLRIEDALNATRAAIEEGIVAGGGVTLIKVQKILSDRLASNAEYSLDERTGAEILMRALDAPLKQIAYNAGARGEVIAEKVRELGGNMGYDAQNDKYVDMFAAGIVDPAKVTRSALENAASIASMLLTTEAAIVDLPEEKGGGGMPDMSGMGGMGY